MHAHPKPNILILMGVSGCGKTTLGRALAEATDGTFLDGDDVHSESNRRKMESGTALDDEDRREWLESIARFITHQKDGTKPVFIACSALKQSYREILRSADPEIIFLFLTTDPDILRQRITERHQSGGHFMPPSLLDSQLATLEIPADAMELDASEPVAELVRRVWPRIRREPV